MTAKLSEVDSKGKGKNMGQPVGELAGDLGGVGARM